jgi:hypothetical protein
MNLQKSNDLRTVAIVPCRSLTRPEYESFVNAHVGMFDKVVFSVQREINWNIERENSNVSIICFPSQSGISAARNRAIEASCDSNSIFYLPNLTTRITSEYVVKTKKIFSLDSTVGAFSGQYLFNGESKRKYVSGPLTGHKLFLAYEPTIAIAGYVLKSLELEFDEELGTGNSETARWSGEGTKLMYSLIKGGFKVIHLNMVAGIDTRDTAVHSARVDYRYARGYIYVTKLISGNLGAMYRCVRTLYKLVPIKRNRRNSSLRFSSSLAFVIGAWSELLGVQTRKKVS